MDTTYGYDTAGRLNNIAHTNGATVIDEYSYSLDGNGNRTAVTSTAGTESYTLDGLNRVTDVSYPGGVSEAFTYDAAGNRIEHTNTDGDTIGYSVDATGQLLSDTTGTTYSYDQAGNLLATSAGDSYVYDDYGRTVEATGNGITQTFGYDATDVRVTVDGIDQLWDRNGGLPTLISTGVGDNYLHTNTGIARDGDEWLLTDAVGSVRATVDDTGATTGSQDFTVFGEQLTGTGDFGFAGEQADLTGQLHLRARQYNPTLGRFTSVDPVQPGAPGTTGYNLYAYSGNNPTTWTDPSGRSAEYGGTLQPSLQATPALVGVGASVTLVYYLALLRQQNVDLDLAQVEDLVGDIGESISRELPPVPNPGDLLREFARRALPLAGTGCIAPAAAEAVVLPWRAWELRSDEIVNAAAAAWCVLPVEWGRDQQVSSGGPGLILGHSETVIINEFKFGRNPLTTIGVFAIHTNLSPCTDGGGCTATIDSLRREFLGLRVVCSYSYSFEHEKEQYREAFGGPMRRIPRPC